MGKLSEVSGNVAFVMDKLSGIRGDLVRNDGDWQSCDFMKLCDALKSWTRRNPVVSAEPPSRNYNTKQQEGKTRACVYCDETSHKSSDCPRIAGYDERKKFLAEKKLCFNCATPKHRAAEWASKARSIFCPKKHHSSICPDQQSKGECVMSSVDKVIYKVIYPVLVIKVGGIGCRALLDSGSSSRSSLKELRCLWLLPQQEWRFSISRRSIEENNMSS